MNNTELLAGIEENAQSALAPCFAEIDRVSYSLTKKLQSLYREFRVSAAHLASSDGYGYGDLGRDTLDKIFARLVGAESAFVRGTIVSGTQALTIGLFGLLRPGDVMLSVTGRPYDTLTEVIGLGGSGSGSGNGSLADFGVEYREIPLGADGGIDMSALGAAIGDRRIKVVYAQRSRGYGQRKTLSPDELNAAAGLVHAQSGAYFVVDNCYGEFCCEYEPYKADMLIGSLIKNPGGGMADCGGYIAGSARAVELASYRLTTVGAGCEVGASLGQNKNLYRGLFYAPHTVAQALKTAHFAAYVFDALGYSVSPAPLDARFDIIQTAALENPEALCAFCRGIQSGSPVDAFAVPEPWDMPGYEDKVIMAAGTFVGGASIELSADGPLRPPYTVFMQGGLTYESGRIGVLSAARELLAIKTK